MRTTIVRIAIVVWFLCDGFAAAEEAKTVTIPTPEGEQTATVTTVQPTPQAVKLVSVLEAKRFKSFAENAPRFAAAYLPGQTRFGLKEYDLAFRAWQESSSPQHSPEDMVDTLGAYLGQTCVTELGMEWVTVTDEYGTDFAVRGRNVEVIAFPFSSVLKRIENQEYDFLNAIFLAIQHQLANPEMKPRS